MTWRGQGAGLSRVGNEEKKSSVTSEPARRHRKLRSRKRHAVSRRRSSVQRVLGRTGKKRSFVVLHTDRLQEVHGSLNSLYQLAQMKAKILCNVLHEEQILV